MLGLPQRTDLRGRRSTAYKAMHAAAAAAADAVNVAAGQQLQGPQQQQQPAKRQRTGPGGIALAAASPAAATASAAATAAASASASATATAAVTGDALQVASSDIPTAVTAATGSAGHTKQLTTAATCNQCTTSQPAAAGCKPCICPQPTAAVEHTRLQPADACWQWQATLCHPSAEQHTTAAQTVSSQQQHRPYQARPAANARQKPLGCPKRLPITSGPSLPAPLLTGSSDHSHSSLTSGGSSGRAQRRQWERTNRRNQLLQARDERVSSNHGVSKLQLTGAFNLSSRSFDVAVLQVLNCGLKFIPTPARRTNAADVQQSLEHFARQVRLRFHFGGTESNERSFDPRYHVPNPAFEPDAAPAAVESFLSEVFDSVRQCYAAQQVYAAGRPANLSLAQQAAVTSLSSDRSVVIKPSDKNLGPVILDVDRYERLLLSVLNDASQYTVSTAPDFSRLRSQLVALLDRWQHVMGAPVYKYLTSLAELDFSIPQPYALPKIHKLPEVSVQYLERLAARVIGPCHSWVTTGCSQYIADKLNAACSAKFPHVLPDSRTLVRRLEGKHVARDSILVTFDVAEMYPNIDSVGAARAGAAAAEAPKRSMMYDMLTFVLENSYLERDGTVYKQSGGVTMGTSCAPPVANIYMASEFEATAQRIAGSDWPEYYYRLIDDGFFIWEDGAISLAAFRGLLESVLPNIRLQFTSDPVRIQYLDLWVVKDLSVAGDRIPIRFETYQKPHNKYLYIPFASHHRPHVFKAFIRGELIRYTVTNTRQSDYAKVAALFQQRLELRGYPSDLLQETFSSVSHANRQAYLQPPDNSNGGNSSNSRSNRSAPVLVFTNGVYEQHRMKLGQVVNEVYSRFSHLDELQQMFGGKVTVAYRNPPSLGKLLVKASH